jgi:lysophospholipase L1-like esterase
VKVLALVLASLFLSLAICEAGLRIFHYGASTPEHPPTVATPDKPLDPGEATRYIAALPAAPGTDRRWFTEDPPPLPNRAPVSQQRIDRYHDFERRGVYGPQADYIWNRKYVEQERCKPSGNFRRYPETVMVFDPPRGEAHPRFRFAPSTTTLAGLVTNDFGFRGPPIALAKPAGTVRIAFLGASTTVNTHSYGFSYPERVIHWLNLFAESNRYPVRFEVLNAGREGLTSEDISPILRDEVLPLDPDLAVYYEGSNQFLSARRMAMPPAAERNNIDARDPMAAHIIGESARRRFALANLADRALNGFSSLNEPRKPLHFLLWPIAVDEQNPDLGARNLPLGLSRIIKDLDLIRGSMGSIGGGLALCSFEWLANDGLGLSSSRHVFIYKQLNTSLWPLLYAEIRQLADFQNRVLRRYAEARDIPFLDVAGALPQDPNLFVDAIHMTETGESVKAWIVFQQLVPLVRKRIEEGQWPRPAGSHALPPPSLAASEMQFGCGKK